MTQTQALAENARPTEAFNDKAAKRLKANSRSPRASTQTYKTRSTIHTRPDSVVKQVNQIKNTVVELKNSKSAFDSIKNLDRSQIRKSQGAVMTSYQF
jgi:DNA-binding ferritin-like protein